MWNFKCESNLGLALSGSTEQHHLVAKLVKVFGITHNLADLATHFRSPIERSVESSNVLHSIAHRSISHFLMSTCAVFRVEVVAALEVSSGYRMS
jgi:hypothetical protein